MVVVATMVAVAAMVVEDYRTPPVTAGDITNKRMLGGEERETMVSLFLLCQHVREALLLQGQCLKRMAITPLDQTTFQNAYSGEAPAWEIPTPQKALVAVADQIHGTLLDSGCGTGENALFFAARGCTVTGYDFVPDAIQRAASKAQERGIAATFLVKDGLTLGDWDEQFDNIIDSGVFHVFSDEDAARYVMGLAHVLKPGGRLFLICFSDAEPGLQGPRRISKQMLHDRFQEGWTVESVTPSNYNVRPEYDGSRYSAGGPKAWFAIIRKKSFESKP